MPARKPTSKDLELFENTLRHALRVIGGDIRHLESETFGSAAPPASLDSGENGYAQEFSLELLERDENTMRELMSALERLQDGTYGRCETCEKWIAKARLKAIPHARHCIECQRMQENGRAI